MTEAEWLGCNDPQPMLHFLRDSRSLSERKVQLFAAACCRRNWKQLTPEGRRAIELAELYADGQVGAKQMAGAARAASYQSGSAGRAVREAANLLIWPMSPEDRVARSAEVARDTARVRGGVAEAKVLAGLLREIVGNPFRPGALDPAWLAWNANRVVQLAQSIHDELESERLPFRGDLRGTSRGTLDPVRLGILADAVEDAGCDDADILTHLRDPGPHVRGCWAVDLILGRS